MDTCVVRNKLSEVCEKYLTKGDKIYLEGRIKNRKWQGENGEDRYTTEIIVNEFTFLSIKKEMGIQSNPTSNESPKVSDDQSKDDLPF